MGHYTYALYASTFEPTTTDKVFTDIGKQFTLMWDHCHDSKNGLLRHGWDSTKKMKWADPTTGASPEVWSRVSLTSPPSPDKNDKGTLIANSSRKFYRQ